MHQDTNIYTDHNRSIVWHSSRFGHLTHCADACLVSSIEAWRCLSVVCFVVPRCCNRDFPPQHVHNNDTRGHTYGARDNCTHYRGITTAVVYIHPRHFSLHNMDLYFCSKSFIFGSLLETHPRNFQILQLILLDRRRIYICCLDVPHCGAFYSMPPLWNGWRQVLCSCVQ